MIYKTNEQGRLKHGARRR